VDVHEAGHLVAAVCERVRHLRRDEDERAWARDESFAVDGERQLAIEDVEGIAFAVVVCSSGPSRRGLTVTIARLKRGESRVRARNSTFPTVALAGPDDNRPLKPS